MLVRCLIRCLHAATTDSTGMAEVVGIVLYCPGVDAYICPMALVVVTVTPLRQSYLCIKVRRRRRRVDESTIIAVMTSL